MGVTIFQSLSTGFYDVLRSGKIGLANLKVDNISTLSL